MTGGMIEKPADSITGYHAHVYYDDPDSRAFAGTLRERLDTLFEVKLGRWRDEPVGPHPTPMYQVAFAPDQFERLVPWLALNHGELSVFIHPETGDAVADHADHALWLGRQQELDIEFLRRMEAEEKG